MGKTSAFSILAFLFLLNIVAGMAAWEFSRVKPLEVDFLDVGQGDSIFIETSQKHQILIDGGPSSVILEKLGDKMPFWDRTIDLVVLTHPEKDHLAGLLEVLKKYRVENILWTGIVRETAEYKEWRKLMEDEKARVFVAQAGQKIFYDENNFIEILSPFESLEGRLFKESNDTSVVCRLVFGKNSFLFTGDISAKTEKELVEKQNLGLDSDVLKISHHGSKYSSAEEFLQAVSPQFAVIQAGKNNSYGHPAQETLARLKNQQVFVTAENGDIICCTDSKTIDCRGSR